MNAGWMCPKCGRISIKDDKCIMVICHVCQVPKEVVENEK